MWGGCSSCRYCTIPLEHGCRIANPLLACLSCTIILRQLKDELSELSKTQLLRMVIDQTVRTSQQRPRGGMPTLQLRIVRLRHLALMAKHPLAAEQDWTVQNWSVLFASTWRNIARFLEKPSITMRTHAPRVAPAFLIVMAGESQGMYWNKFLPGDIMP